jgi:hypothetical protein
MCSNLVIILNHKSFVSSEQHRMSQTIGNCILHYVQHKENQDIKSYVKMPYEPFGGYLHRTRYLLYL